MARFAHSDRAPVDVAVDRLRRDCLVKDGSMLFPEQELWNATNFAGLGDCFNEEQLTDERSFEEKLQTQLDGAPLCRCA